MTVAFFLRRGCMTFLTVLAADGRIVSGRVVSGLTGTCAGGGIDSVCNRDSSVSSALFVSSVSSPHCSPHALSLELPRSRCPLRQVEQAGDIENRFPPVQAVSFSDSSSIPTGSRPTAKGWLPAVHRPKALFSVVLSGYNSVLCSLSGCSPNYDLLPPSLRYVLLLILSNILNRPYDISSCLRCCLYP